MNQHEDPNGVILNWREMVKGKERRLFGLHERLLLRLNNIKKHIFTHHLPLTEWDFQQCYFRDIDNYDFIYEDRRTITVGEPWGGHDITALFKRDIQIPDEWAGQPVALRFYIGGDSLLKIDGVPYHGMDPFRNEVLLTSCAQGGECYTVEVEAYVNWHTGEADKNTFHLAELAVIDEDIRSAYWDFRAVFKVLDVPTVDPGLRKFLEYTLSDLLWKIPDEASDQTAFKQVLLDAAGDLRRRVYQNAHFRPEGKMYLIGHSHLDLVFMWPYREFVRKIGRTHATMLRLMEQYPEFRFSQSQAKTYADMKVYFPEIFEQVRARVAEGRWEPVGAFWVEPDCNLISGESFVRQIIYGQRFWEEEFGLQSNICWQPDVFGLSWALPQILHRSGIKYMLTNKHFVWNDTNPWRTNNFWWEGPDGSRVLTVIPPGHFIGMMDPDHMAQHWLDFSDKETIGESIYCYGWGDGGGGVDPEMLECARRYRSFPGLVDTEITSAEEAFASIEQKAIQHPIPVWRDELYLEAHRGTYTNKGRLKKLNRQSELLYREAELLATFAWLRGESYPADQLDEGWRMLLTTQFHDSLPGTHIHEVYPMLLSEFETLETIGRKVRTNAFTALVEAQSEGDHLVIFNSLIHPRAGITALSAASLPTDVGVADLNGEPLRQQAITTLDGTRQILVDLPEIPGVGYRVLQLMDNEPTTASDETLHVTATTLENVFLRLELNNNGEIVSLYDKENKREVMLPGQTGNRFQLFEDRPGKYDAWDIAASYVEHEISLNGETQLTIDETGPLRASIRIVKHLFHSTFIQRISLTCDERAVTFETEIDWHERQRLLKVAFPANINAMRATYDMAFGNIERSTHRNTPFDAARFEVPAHQWMDLSQDEYGVALLNDCKYGHDTHDHTMRLTLLKGSIYPDPDADREVHHFTYVLYPHAGNWRSADVVQKAANLNNPPYCMRSNSTNLPEAHAFLSCDAPNITLEAVKRSEDGSSLIARLVERYNRSSPITITFDRLYATIKRCNLMEAEEETLATDTDQIVIHVNPYEIVTLKCQL